MTKKEEPLDIRINWWGLGFGAAGLIIGGYLVAKFILSVYK